MMIPGAAWARLGATPMPWAARWFQWETLCVLAAQQYGWLPTDTMAQPIGVLARLLDLPKLREVRRA